MKKEKNKKLKKEYLSKQNDFYSQKMPSLFQIYVINLNEPFSCGPNLVVFEGLKSLLNWARGDKVSGIAEDSALNTKKKIKKIEYVLIPFFYIKKSKKSFWIDNMNDFFSFDENEAIRYKNNTYDPDDEYLFTPKEYRDHRIKTLSKQKEKALEIIDRSDEEFFAICREEKLITYI